MKTGKYRHFKGKEYEVLGIVRHTETEERLVLYRPLCDCPVMKDEYGFVRPLGMFRGDVEVDGVTLPRFQCIED